jgi:hypothetical protein
MAEEIGGALSPQQLQITKLHFEDSLAYCIFTTLYRNLTKKDSLSLELKS